MRIPRKPISRNALRQIRRNIPCPKSPRYDEEHIRQVGDDCLYKHTIYAWQGALDSRACLLSDSICKWFQGIPHLDIRAIPSLTLAPALEKITSGILTTSNYDAILIHIGGNDISNKKLTPNDIMRNMEAIIDHIKSTTPQTRIGICFLIPRLNDSAAELKKRHDTNCLLRKLCKQHKIAFLNVFKGVSYKNVLDKSRYAKDDIHLNGRGIGKMIEYFWGATAAILSGTKSKSSKTSQDQPI